MQRIECCDRSVFAFAFVSVSSCLVVILVVSLLVSRRILHIIDSLGRTGVASQLLVLARGLVRAGFRRACVWRSIGADRSRVSSGRPEFRRRNSAGAGRSIRSPTGSCGGSCGGCGRMWFTPGTPMPAMLRPRSRARGAA